MANSQTLDLLETTPLSTLTFPTTTKPYLLRNRPEKTPSSPIKPLTNQSKIQLSISTLLPAPVKPFLPKTYRPQTPKKQISKLSILTPKETIWTTPITPSLKTAVNMSQKHKNPKINSRQSLKKPTTLQSVSFNPRPSQNNNFLNS